MPDTSQSQHTIAGTVLTMPVRVRQAQQHTAMFAVDADAAQQMIDYSGLQVRRIKSGKAVVVLMLMHYIDTDLGQYYEYGTNVMVRDGSGPMAAFVHHLPVDQAFTLEAGRSIWGYPKVMADFQIREGRRGQNRPASAEQKDAARRTGRFGFDVTHDDKLIIDMEFAPGLPIPSVLTSREQVYPTYSYLDGVLRRTEGVTRLSGVRYRIGGVRVQLGDHPYADELRAIGLPKRAFMSGSAANVDMTFGDAQEISH